MSRKTWLALVAAMLGAGLLVAAATAAPTTKTTGAAADAAHAKKGGTVVMELDTDIDYNDPQLTYYTPSWTLQYATACKLFNWPDKEGAAGGALTPEVSAGQPVVSKNGKTYVFTIKSGFKFSNGQAVTAQSFKNSWERLANPKMASQGSPFLDVVQGAQAVIDGKASSLSGVKVIGEQAFGHADQVCPRLPRAADDAVLPGNRHQPRDDRSFRRPDVRVVRPVLLLGLHAEPLDHAQAEPELQGLAPEQPGRDPGQRRQLARDDLPEHHSNKTDYGAAIPPASGPRSQSSSRSTRRTAGTRRGPTLVIDYVALNHDRPLFKNNPKLAKAVNWAVDRQAYVAQRGFQAGKRADQILPPGMAGFKDRASTRSRSRPARSPRRRSSRRATRVTARRSSGRRTVARRRSRRRSSSST